MSTNTTTRVPLGVRLGLALLLSFACIALAVQPQLSARVAGETYLLRVSPLDPIDPFRGAYVTLAYPDLPGGGNTSDDTDLPDARRVYVPLRAEGAVHVGEAPRADRPADGPYLRCANDGWMLDCGIDSWFLPQDRAQQVERAVADGEMVARIRVDGNGNAALLGLEPAP